jgi:hypothetical protein
MLTTKIKENRDLLNPIKRTLNDIDLTFYNSIHLNKNNVYYDYDLKRVAEFILLKNQYRYKAIQDITISKIDSLFNLKGNLNLKRKMFIDSLRIALNGIYSGSLFIENPLKLNWLNFQDLRAFLIENKITNKDNIPINILYKFYSENHKNINTLMDINDDLKHIDILIKDFKIWFKSFVEYSPFLYGNNKALNSRDIETLKGYWSIEKNDGITENDGIYNLKFNKGYITQNLKEVMYFYLIKLKKSKTYKVRENKTNIIEKDFNLNNCNDENILKNVIEQNHILSFDDSINKLYDRFRILENNILNKYI